MKFAKLEQLEKALDNLEAQKETLDPSILQVKNKELIEDIKLTIGTSYQTR